MTPAQALAIALGHVRNTTWQLLGNNQTDGLILGLECLDLEALLNPNDLDPAVVDLETSAAASLAAASRILEAIPEHVVPAAWLVLASLTAKVG